jgi:hypothetical protein
MGAIQQIFHRFGPEYLARFGEHIPAQPHKVIEAICQCRTEAYGSVCYQCEDCGHPHVLPAACGNRHCPQCQHRKTQQWLERGLQRQLPGHHFMLTLTVPEPLRAFLRSHQNWATTRCSRPPPKPSRPWCTIPASSAPIEPASSVCSTPGADSCSITPTSITWYRAGHSPRMAPGMPRAPASSCP